MCFICIWKFTYNSNVAHPLVVQEILIDLSEESPYLVVEVHWLQAQRQVNRLRSFVVMAVVASHVHPHIED
jgi:hypothetical protein